jgi:eukaryotic-like serine/threonine-protein kinase
VSKPDSTDSERIGSYRVLRRLATGGTSDVLLARAEGPHGFERPVVLKVLLAQLGEDEEFGRMFAREASAYARLTHPCIVRLYDFFAVPAGEPRVGQLVMVLELVDGHALSRIRSIFKTADKDIDDASALAIGASVFSALAAAHNAVDDAGVIAPVIHRDVNPSNILIGWNGDVKLADFGVAKVTGLQYQSVAGLIKGTYGYMAPEQVNGETITPRADVYAGAVVMWELFARRRAFQRGTLGEAEALRLLAEPQLPSLDTLRPDVPLVVRDALKRALEPKASARKITAEELAAVFLSILSADEGRARLSVALDSVRNDAPAPSSRDGATIAAGPPKAAFARTLPSPIAAPRPQMRPELARPRPGVSAHDAPRGLSATARLAEAFQPAPGLSESIDAILGSPPSSGSAPKESTRVMPNAPRPPLGNIPAAPAPMAAPARLVLDSMTPPSAPPARTDPLPRIATLAFEQRPASARPQPPRPSPSGPLPPALGPESAPEPASGPQTAPVPPAPQPNPPAAISELRVAVPEPVPRRPEMGYPSTHAPPRRSNGGLMALVCLLVAVAAFGVVAARYWQRHRRPPVVATTVPEPAMPPLSAAPSASAVPSASAAPSAAPLLDASAPVDVPASAASAAPRPPASDSGSLKTTDATPHRRIFVDERVVGQTPETVTVKCGTHTVRLGSAGKPQSIDVPCGGEVVVGDK